MLSQPLLAKLRQLGLTGFQAALEEQQRNSQYAGLSFEDRLGMMIDRECLRRRIKAAGFALPASLEDLDFSPRRGLARSLMLELAQGEWIHRCLNVLVLGPTGAGKSYLACTLGHAACRQDYSVRYERISRLLHELMLSHADGSYLKLLHGLSRVKLLICDDWLRDPSPWPRPETFSRSWMTATVVPPPWLPRRSRWKSGMPVSQTRPWPMPCSIAWSTMPTAWS